MFLIYIATFFYVIIFLLMFGISAYISHKSMNARYIAAWWLGILMHILFPLAFMVETEDGYKLNIFIKEIQTVSMLIIFIIEFIFGLLMMTIMEKANRFPEKLMAIIFSILSYSSIYALLMIIMLKSGATSLFWLNGFIISVLFYLSFISNNSNDIFNTTEN